MCVLVRWGASILVKISTNITQYPGLGQTTKIIKSGEWSQSSCDGETVLIRSGCFEHGSDGCGSPWLTDLGRSRGAWAVAGTSDRPGAEGYQAMLEEAARVAHELETSPA